MRSTLFSVIVSWFGNADGSFTVGPTSTLNVQGTLTVGDFDGDGNADVLSQFNTYGNSIQVAYGDGHGNFQVQPAFGDDAYFEAYDLNGDGAMDLVGHPFDFSINGSKYYPLVRVWYGHSNRTFTKQDIPLAQCDARAYPPAVTDLNGDGVNDLVVEEASDCNGSAPFTLAVKLGNGDGTFQPEQPFYSSDEIPTTLAPIRVNQDSKPDLRLFSEALESQDSQLTLFMNSTPGNFPKCAPPLRETGFNLCSPTKTVSGSTSVKFNLSAANQTNGRKMEVWVDGKKMAENLKDAFSHYTFLDATLLLTPGTHRVDIYSAGWDDLLQSYMWTGGAGFSIPLTVKSSACPVATGLTICGPLNEATVASPVRAWASGSFSGTKTQRMEVWVDREKKFSTFDSNTLDTKIPLAAGIHQLTYYLVGADGSITHNSVFATVR